MRHRRTILIGFCSAATMVVALAAALRGGNEPRCDGRSLSVWVMRYYESDRPSRDPAQRHRAAAAILALRTNALPTLLKNLQYETPAWHRSLAGIMPRWIGNSRPARATIYRRHHLSEASYKALLLLGTNTAAAIPELAALARDKTHPQTAQKCIDLLSRAGHETTLPGR